MKWSQQKTPQTNNQTNITVKEKRFFLKDTHSKKKKKKRYTLIRLLRITHTSKGTSPV